MDFVEICNVYTRKVIIKVAKRIFNSDKICRSYCDFYFGVTFFGTHCILSIKIILSCLIQLCNKNDILITPEFVYLIFSLISLIITGSCL